MNIDGNKCIEDVLSQGKEGSERKTKRLYFVEDYAPFIHDLDGTIIALNPMTCAMLDEEKIEYQVIEDFYDASERVKYGDEYHERLSAWITKFDQYLNSKVENSIDKQIEFLRAHGYFVKNYVDSLLVNVFNYVSILDALNPSEVVVVSKRKPEIALMSGIKKWIFNVDPSVLKIVCEKRGVPFCYEMVAKETSDVPKISSKNLLNKVRLFIKNNKRGVELFLLRILFFPKRMKRKKEGVFKKFLLVNDDWLIDFYKNAIIAGYDVAYFSEKGPRKFPAKVPEDESLSMDEEKRVVQWKRVAKDCFREFNPSLWVNVEAGLDISQIFDRCIQYFLETVCPQISKYVQEYTIYFDKFGITHAICDIKVTPAAVGVMFAAFLKENVVAAQIEHGETTGEDHVFLYSERPVDLYISCSKDQESFFKEFLNNDSRKKIEVVAGDVWNKRYKKYFDIIADKKNLKVNKSGVRETICYVPSSSIPLRFNYSYPSTFYYNLQKSLITYFAERNDFDFIVKGHKRIAKDCDILKRIIRDTGTGNVIFEDGDLIETFCRSDRVLLDFPATPAFEARLMGLPILELCYESIKIIKSSKLYYGKTLEAFSSVNEAIDHVEKFLNSDSREYFVSMRENVDLPYVIDII